MRASSATNGAQRVAAMIRGRTSDDRASEMPTDRLMDHEMQSCVMESQSRGVVEARATGAAQSTKQVSLESMMKVHDARAPPNRNESTIPRRSSWEQLDGNFEERRLQYEITI